MYSRVRHAIRDWKSKANVGEPPARPYKLCTILEILFKQQTFSILTWNHIEREKSIMLTALYDGNCVVCRSTCGAMRALDWRKRIKFVDLHEGAGWRERYPDLSHEHVMREIHVIDGQRRVYAGFEGTRRMLREAPLGFPLWLLLRLPGMDALGARVYRYIARRRYRINTLLGVELTDCDDDSCGMLR